MSAPLVYESPSGMRHGAFFHSYGSTWTLCARRVPQHRGWFGPVDRSITCQACLRDLDRRAS